MADHFYSVIATDGRLDRTVTVGTSTSATAPIEIRVLDGQGVKKRDIVLSLLSFIAYFEKNNVPA
jgi:hypothetical protein